MPIQTSLLNQKSSEGDEAECGFASLEAFEEAHSGAYYGEAVRAVRRC